MLWFSVCRVSQWEYYQMPVSPQVTDLVSIVQHHKERRKSFTSWTARNSWLFQVLYIDFLADQNTGFCKVANYNSLNLRLSLSYEHHSLVISAFLQSFLVFLLHLLLIVLLLLLLLLLVLVLLGLLLLLILLLLLLILSLQRSSKNWFFHSQLYLAKFLDLS